MLGDDGLPAFGENADAVRALQFYTDFANPAKDVYTWNEQSDYSIDSFAQGSAAMMINYSYNIDTLKAKNPRLNFAVAPLPQVETGGTPVTYGGYWLYVVSKQTTSADTAWRFVRFMTSTAQARSYLEKSGYPPARRDLVQELQSDARIGVFANQSLYAKSWSQADSRLVDKLFVGAIDEVITGQDTVDGALKRVVEQLKAAAVSANSANNNN
jgi:ABC-type glycerol-3-phosphate transport system substrate-binding protein